MKKLGICLLGVAWASSAWATGILTDSGAVIPFEIITFNLTDSGLSVDTSTFGPAAVTTLGPDVWDVSFAELGRGPGGSGYPGFYIKPDPTGEPAIGWETGDGSGLVNFVQGINPYLLEVFGRVTPESVGVTRSAPNGGLTAFGGGLVYELDPPFPDADVPLGAVFYDSVPDSGATLGLLLIALAGLAGYLWLAGRSVKRGLPEQRRARSGGLMAAAVRGSCSPPP